MKKAWKILVFIVVVAALVVVSGSFYTTMENEYSVVKQFGKIVQTNDTAGLRMKMPFIQTSLLINELVNLEYTTVGTDIKIKEIGTNRKDRYSSISYANQFANELERKLARPRISSDGIRLHTRVPKCMAIKERR